MSEGTARRISGRAAFAASVLLREVETAWMEEVASRRVK